MNGSLRNTVLVLAIASFASMASGLTLYLHLASVGGADHHDAAHCPLCSVMVLGAAKVTLEVQSPFVCSSSLIETIPETGGVSPRQYALPVLAPRPPPGVMV